ncbi:hypothetical protein BOQ60_23900, partial [Chryseobacterium sp. CH1]
EFTEIVRQLGKEGRTVLMATHDIFNAVSVATNIGIMKQGELVQNLNFQSVYSAGITGAVSQNDLIFSLLSY